MHVYKAYFNDQKNYICELDLGVIAQQFHQSKRGKKKFAKHVSYMYHINKSINLYVYEFIDKWRLENFLLITREKGT